MNMYIPAPAIEFPLFDLFCWNPGLIDSDGAGEFNGRFPLSRFIAFVEGRIGLGKEPCPGIPLDIYKKIT